MGKQIKLFRRACKRSPYEHQLLGGALVAVSAERHVKRVESFTVSSAEKSRVLDVCGEFSLAQTKNKDVFGI